MRKLILTGIILSGLMLFKLRGQEKIMLPNDYMQTELSVKSGVISGHYRLSYFEVFEESESDSETIRLSLPDAFPSGNPGAPELPAFSVLVEADHLSSYRLSVDHIDSTVLDMNDLFPQKHLFSVREPVRKGIGNRSEKSDKRKIPVNHEISNRHALVIIEPQGKLRGISISRIQLSPFRYNPDNHELTVYHSVDFSLIPETHVDRSGADISVPFRSILSNVILDDDRSVLKRIVSEKPVTMVILSDTIFRNALQPLVQWKTMKGFRVIEAYTSDPEVGKTGASIRDYMHGLYNDPPEGYAPPSYLLIAGDVDHVPLSQSSGQVTDLYYTTFDGEGDYLPEMFHGRVSVRNDTQLTHVIDKILMYEQYLMPDPSYLDRSILIAGYDAGYGGLHGNGQIRYAAGNYFNQNNGIDSKIYLHPDAAKMDKEILEEIGAGAALVNYTGHGEYYGWLDPAFRLSNIDTLGNTHKYALMIGNGCSTNQFNLSSLDCFAEAIIKVPDRGAVGYIGCTNDSYWDEDFYWSVGVGSISSDPGYEETSYGYYDKLFHLGQESVTDWAPSLGEMIFAGNMSVQESNSDKKKYYWEIYQLMGDPSMVPWFRQPGTPDVEVPERIPKEATQLSVKASAYDYIALSDRGNLITAKHCDRFGQAIMEIPDTLTASELMIVITGDQRQPFFDTISRKNVRRGYLELAGYRVKKESIVTDGIISAGESFSLDLDLRNSSGSLLRAQALYISCDDPLIQVIDSVVQTVSIQAGAEATLKNAFRIKTASALEDLVTFNLRIRREFGDDDNVMYLNEKIHAPALRSGSIIWDDQAYGNGNGILEDGEKIWFSWEVVNTGSYRSDSLLISKIGDAGQFPGDLHSYEVRGIPAGDTATLKFTGVSNITSENGSPFNLAFIVADAHTEVSDSLFLIPGRHFDDFSTGDLTRFKWQKGITPWTPDSTEFHGGPWSLKSGNIPHGSASSMAIEFFQDKPDSLLFDYLVSSERSYDFLELYVDNVRIDRWSGITGWNRFIYPLDSGRHTIEWRYIKDSNTTNGEDAAWIDNVVFPAGVFEDTDLGLLKLVSPSDAGFMGHVNELMLQVFNSGHDTIQGFSIGYQFEDQPWQEYLFADTLLPRNKKAISLPADLDLSEVGEYHLIAGIDVKGDAYPGNDTVTFYIEHYRYPDLSLSHAGFDSISGEYADLSIVIANQGNVFMEEMIYAYRLNDELVRNDTLEIMLEPGASGEYSISIIEQGGPEVENGWQYYNIVAETDSVNGNNQVAGEIYWAVQQSPQFRRKNMSIYPNPAQKYFTISIGSKEGGPFSIEFCNIHGRVIHRQTMYQDQVVFDASSVFEAPGIYLIRVLDDEGALYAVGKLQVARQEVR